MFQKRLRPSWVELPVRRTRRCLRRGNSPYLEFEEDDTVENVVQKWVNDKSYY